VNLKLSFSPCPNDTFMFDALVNGRLDKSDFKFDVTLQDIEELNKQVIKSIPDISKISAALYPAVAEKYQILSSGAALGNNNGPILVCKNPIDKNSFGKYSVAIPGLHTTANLLLSIAFPEITNKKEIIFSKIENSLLTEKTDLGLIIHESRFTYQDKGLNKVVDLGEYWEETYKQLIPLGLIVVKRSMPEQIKQQVNQLIEKSVIYAFDHAADSKSYIKKHAQELNDEVIQKHISLYVNQYSINFGEKGKQAISFLFEQGFKMNLLPAIKTKDIYVN
jgi:1,4-dihydroxy-6-naphthoate synthase